jgi:glutathione S-transferase
VKTALEFMEQHLGQHTWFAGEHLTMADFQMSFAVEAALARTGKAADCPRLQAYVQRMQARPAYQRGIAKGGPVVMEA